MNKDQAVEIGKGCIPDIFRKCNQQADDEMDSPAKERVFSRMTVKIPASRTGWVVVIAFT